MRRMTFLLVVVASLMVVSALPAGAAPSNSPNATDLIALECVDDDTGEAVVVNVFAIWNSSGGAYFTEDANGRQYVSSWYTITYLDPPEGFPGVFEKFYGARMGFSRSFTCDAGTFNDGDGLGDYKVEVGLKGK